MNITDVEGLTNSKILETKRQSNIELLRIVGMLLMIGNHYLSGSGIESIFQHEFSWRMFFFQCVGCWGKTLINSFVLITGYFMCKKELLVNQWLKLFMRGKFYLISFWLIFVIAGLEVMSVNGAINVLFAEVLYINQGFAYSFLFFYLLIPFCNYLISVINKQLLMMLIIVGIIIYAVPAWFGNGSTFNYVAWYIVIYFLGAYIRIYEPSWMKNKLICGGALAVSVFLAILSIVLIDTVGMRYGFYEWSYFIKNNSSKPFAILIGLFIFLFFKNINIPYSKVINKIASTTYGILWFHTATPVWRNILWNKIFHVKDFYFLEWWKVPIYFIVVCLSIFIMGCFVDILYAEFIEKPIFDKMSKFKWFRYSLWDFK